MSFCANQDSYFNSSEVREQLSNQMIGKPISDEFQPFKTQPNKFPVTKHDHNQSDIESNITPKKSRLDVGQLTMFNNASNTNILYYLKIKKIVGMFREFIMKRASLLPQSQIIRLQQLSIYQEKYLTYQKKLSGFQTYFILDPTNPFILLQDQLILLLVLSLLLLIPYFWSFQENQSPIKDVLIFVGSLLLILDAISKLNTAIMDKGNIIHDRIEILKQNSLKVFFQDVVFILNLNYVTNIQSAMFIGLFCVLGFVKFYQYFEKLLDVLDLPLLYKEILSLVKLLVVIILVAHIIACFWHYIGIITIESYDASWITVKGLQNESNSTQYIYSYYWAIVTMVTVGYGDITPQNKIEVLCCTFIMIISCGVFAFSLNKVGQVIQNLNDQQAESREVMRTLTAYMKQHSVPNQLQGRVRNYLQYIMGQKEYKINAQQIIDTLSSDLKIELMYNVFSNLTNNCKLFSLNFAPPTIKKLSLLLQPQLYSPGDVIFTQNEIDECSLYFVDQGSISLIESQTKTTILQCSKGSYFGEASFFTQMPHSFTAVSKTFSRVYIVKRKDFLDALTVEELEQFLSISHLFMLKQPIQGYRCQLCQNGSHQLADCNFIKYTPDVERVILKYKQEHQNRDRHFIRNNKRYKINCLLNMEKIRHCQNEFALLLEEDASEEYDIQQGYSSQALSDENSPYNKNKSIVSLNNQKLVPPKTQNYQQQKTAKLSIVQKVVENQLDVQKPAELPSSMNLPSENIKSDGDLVSKQNIPKIYSRVDNRQLTQQQFSLKFLEEFDKMKLFSRYLLQNNYNVVITGYNKFIKLNKRFTTAKSKYRLGSKQFGFSKIIIESQRKRQRQNLNQ